MQEERSTFTDSRFIRIFDPPKFPKFDPAYLNQRPPSHAVHLPRYPPHNAPCLSGPRFLLAAISIFYSTVHENDFSP